MLAGRIEIDDVAPVVSGGRFPAKAVTGEVVPVTATVWREGHDAVAATLVVRYHGTAYPRLAKTPAGVPAPQVTAVPIEEVVGSTPRVKPQLLAMSPGRTPDVFHGQFTPDAVGLWTFRVDGWGNPLATWRKNITAKLEAGQGESELSNDLIIGAQLLERASTGVPRQDRYPLIDAAARLREPGDPFARAGAALAPEVTDLLRKYPLRELVTRGEQHGVWVDRPLARFSAWYEMFPRSTGGWDDKGNPVHGTFATASKALPRIAKMGFDIVYLPPIHPIGKVHRKGRNNSVTAAPKDVGSPWAIGSDKGGHDAVHPKLGTIEDFDDFVAAARDQGLEVALDLALQCAPDHPWAKDHPEWFTVLPDGTIAYAENPPKKYQDIYPVNFDNDPAGIYAEVLRVVRFWMSHGVKVFRVDNPHTKPPNFWAWLIGEAKNDDPDVLFLAEAFTRPARLFGLAKLGYTQSYTYFTWRTAKWELQEFGEQIAEHADYSRQSLWTNTPDILHESLQHGGPGMFAIRASMAATMSPTWGVYSGYELFEHEAVREGSEEYLDSEKYQLRPRDFDAALANGESLEPFLQRLNEIRHLHPALSQLRTIKFHPIDNDALLAYSKFDPVTGDEYQWGQANYVRIDPARSVAHILNMPQISPEKRLNLLRRE